MGAAEQPQHVKQVFTTDTNLLRPADANSEGPMRNSVSFAPDGGAQVVAPRRARPAGEAVAA